VLQGERVQSRQLVVRDAGRPHDRVHAAREHLLEVAEHRVRRREVDRHLRAVGVERRGDVVVLVDGAGQLEVVGRLHGLHEARADPPERAHDHDSPHAGVPPTSSAYW